MSLATYVSGRERECDLCVSGLSKWSFAEVDTHAGTVPDPWGPADFAEIASQNDLRAIELDVTDFEGDRRLSNCFSPMFERRGWCHSRHRWRGEDRPAVAK